MCFLAFLPWGLTVTAELAEKAVPAMFTACETAFDVTVVRVFFTKPIGFFMGIAWEAGAFPSSLMLKESMALARGFSRGPLLF